MYVCMKKIKITKSFWWYTAYINYVCTLLATTFLCRTVSKTYSALQGIGLHNCIKMCNIPWPHFIQPL